MHEILKTSALTALKEMLRAYRLADRVDEKRMQAKFDLPMHGLGLQQALA